MRSVAGRQKLKKEADGPSNDPVPTAVPDL
jgi:hypothetical protein